jgi:hypothetical protein
MVGDGAVVLGKSRRPKSDSRKVLHFRAVLSHYNSPLPIMSVPDGHGLDG